MITLIGKKESVQAAKKELSDMLKDLDKVTESEMSVEPQFHRHFVLRRGEVLRHIADELGGVSISFPKAGTNSSRVVLKGTVKIHNRNVLILKAIAIVKAIEFINDFIRSTRVCGSCQKAYQRYCC